MSAAAPSTRRSPDGRSYPLHLKAVEPFDADFVPLLEESGVATFDELSMRVCDRRARAALVRWLASAEWRGIVERRINPRGPRLYALA